MISKSDGDGDDEVVVVVVVVGPSGIATGLRAPLG